MPQDDIIPLHNHPKWKAKNDQQSEQPPQFVQGTIQSIQSSDRPHHTDITVSLTDDSTYTALITPHTPKDAVQTILRAAPFDHEIRIGLTKNTQGTPVIIHATDMTETMLQNGPFGEDRKQQLKNGDSSVGNFLVNAGKPYRLTKAHVARLWTWPTADFPELPNALTSFATIPPKHIGTSDTERTGMTGALLLGMAEETYGKKGAVVARLNSAQGRWDKLGQIMQTDGPNQIFEAIHHQLPAVTALAAGAAGAQDNDLTLPTRHAAVWENVGPEMVQRFTKGSMQDVVARTKILNAILTQTDTHLSTPEDSAKQGWQYPEHTNKLVESLSRNVFNTPLEKSEASALFLGEMMPKQSQKDNKSRD